MKILVTGGTGQIGSAVQQHLASLGWEVVTVSRRGDIVADLSRVDCVVPIGEA